MRKATNSITSETRTQNCALLDQQSFQSTISYKGMSFWKEKDYTDSAET